MDKKVKAEILHRISNALDEMAEINNTSTNVNIVYGKGLHDKRRWISFNKERKSPVTCEMELDWQ